MSLLLIVAQSFQSHCCLPYPGNCPSSLGSLTSSCSVHWAYSEKPRFFSLPYPGLCCGHDQDVNQESPFCGLTPVLPKALEMERTTVHLAELQGEGGQSKEPVRKVLREGNSASDSPSSTPLPCWILGDGTKWPTGELSLLRPQDSQVLGEGKPLSFSHGPCYCHP